MAVNSTIKAQDIKRDLADLFVKELASSMPYVAYSFDTLGNPSMVFSADATPTATHKVLVITVAPYLNGTALDVFGNTANAYSNPTKIQICTEANAASYPNVLSVSDLLPVLAEIAKRGTIIEWHQTATTVLPTAAVIVAGASLVATYKPLYWGIQSAV